MRVTEEQYDLFANRVKTPLKRMRVQTLIGIDPGTHTGVAVMTTNDLRVKEYDFWGCYHYVLHQTFPQTTLLIIEEGGLNAPLFFSIAKQMEEQARARGQVITPQMRDAFRRAENKHAMNVGAANQEAELLIRGFREADYQVITFRPMPKKKWKTHELAKQITGIQQRTNDHTRVALQAVWDHRHLLQVGVYEYK